MSANEQWKAIGEVFIEFFKQFPILWAIPIGIGIYILWKIIRKILG